MSRPLSNGGIGLDVLSRGFTPGCHITGFEPCRLAARLYAEISKQVVLRRLQAETENRY